MSALAAVLWASAGLVMATAVLVAVVKGFKRIEASIGRVHVVADAVNNAVNNVGSNEPTLRQLVVGISDRLTEHSRRLDRIEDHITQPRGGH